MAGLLLAAMLAPMLPAFELPHITLSAAEEGGGGGGSSTSYTYNIVNADGDGYLDVAQSDSTTVTGTNQTISVDSENTQIIVNGDYYKETEQFNPKVGEVWSGNALPANSAALWIPTWSELPSWFTDNLLASEGYAALYTGFMEKDNTYVNKPYGVTRVGEILGYDVYAAEGEDYVSGLDGSQVLKATAQCTLLEPTDYVSKNWAMMNIYRALGVERYQLVVSKLPKDFRQMADVVGENKIKVTYNDKGEPSVTWDLNRSPVTQFLTGNITAGYTGDSEPVVVVWASRTHIEDYIEQAAHDRLEYQMDSDYSPVNATQITCAEFCRWVAFLMEAYGEPVITEQEQYMLLEAYGRKLPYDEVYPSELEAIKYLMVRGIIDGTDELKSMLGPDKAWSWNTPINFEQATTILMRVKDKGSRLTFKEFQLTTDLSLLKQGYYPVDLPLTESAGGIYINELGYLPADRATHYDYLVRRSDNRALFLSADETGGGSSINIETAPHVAIGHDAVDSRLPNSYYRGRTQDGWYWFQVPTDYKGAGPDDEYVYINSAHSSNDSPAQYKLPVGGGYFIADVSAPNTDAYTATRSAGFGDDVQYVCDSSFERATRVSTAGTADIVSQKNRTTMYALQVHRPLVMDNPDTADLKLCDTAWITRLSQLKYYNQANQANQDTYDQYVYVKPGKGSPMAYGGSKPDGDGWVKCYLYKAQSYDSTAEYLDLIVVAEEPITKAMAQAAFNLHDPCLKAGLGVKGTSPVRTMRAYCRFGDEYLVSVEYLKAQQVVKDFLNYAPGKYYMSVMGVGTTPATDVYFDTTPQDSNRVIFGNSLYLYSKEDLVVNQMGDDVFVLLSAVNGKVGDAAVIELPGEVPAVALTRPVSVTTTRIVMAGKRQFTMPMHVLEEGDNITASFVNVSHTNPLANYLAVFDRRYGDSAPVLFTLYETGDASRVPADGVQNRARFEELVGWSIGGDSMYYKMVQASPEMTLDENGFRKKPSDLPSDQDTSRLFYSSTGDLLVQVEIAYPDGAGMKSTLQPVPKGSLCASEPVISKKLSDYTFGSSSNWPVIPYVHVPATSTSSSGWWTGSIFSWLSNYYVSGGSVSPAYFNYVDTDGIYGSGGAGMYMCTRELDSVLDEGDAKRFGDNVQDATPVATENLRLQLCGLPALVADFTVTQSTAETDMSSILQRNGSAICYYGCDRSETVYASGKLPFATTAFVMHLASSDVVLQVYNGVTNKTTLGNAGGTSDKVLVKGKPNKINDWLMWLKHAKLSDAEDILTICIIAVLQWLPRIFMFIFFLLMGLSMIASMKPWVIFCDRYFDPYKFLTAGRMDVHTIDIKKVVLCSMIALILFGFFQNGLILDIIAWCARAITGILNR